MKLKKVSGYWMIDDGTNAGGVKSTWGWNRLIETLRLQSDIRDDEDVVGIEIDHNGMQLTVEKRE